MDALVSKPDHGEDIIETFNEKLVASERLQIFFDDIADKVNELAGGNLDPINPDTFLLSSIIYKPSDSDVITPAVINENEFVGRPAGGQIQGLDFNESWAILGNGTNNITINNTGNPFSFTVESNTSSTMFRVDGAANRVSIARLGEAAPDGLFHVLASTALGGPVTADPEGDTLVLEQNQRGGLSILTGSDDTGNIFFGSPAYGERAGHIFFLHDTTNNFPRFGINIRDVNFLRIYDSFGGAPIGGFAFNEEQNASIDIQVNTVTSLATFFIDSSADRIGMTDVGLLPTQGLLDLKQTGSSGQLASTLADILVLDSSAFESGMSFVGGPLDNRQNIMFSGNGVRDRGKLQFKHNANHDFTALIYTTVDNSAVEVEVWRCTEREFVINLGNDNDVNFRCDATSSSNLLYTRSSQTRVGVGDNNNLPFTGLLHIQSGTILGFTSNAGADVG